jgi:hypothetical protein
MSSIEGGAVMVFSATFNNISITILANHISSVCNVLHTELNRHRQQWAQDTLPYPFLLKGD